MAIAFACISLEDNREFPEPKWFCINRLLTIKWPTNSNIKTNGRGGGRNSLNSSPMQNRQKVGLKSVNTILSPDHQPTNNFYDEHSSDGKPRKKISSSSINLSIDEVVLS